MKIKDIMFREIMEAEKQEREKQAAQGKDEARCDKAASVLCIALIWLVSLAVAFMAGATWQRERTLQCSLDFSAWMRKVQADAEREAQNMSNYELLRATEKTEAVK